MLDQFIDKQVFVERKKASHFLKKHVGCDYTTFLYFHRWINESCPD